MTKKLFSWFVVLAFAIPVVSLGSRDFAAGGGELPGEDGTYDVPGHPELKLRVFVHHLPGGENGRPASIGGKPSPTPVLSCGLTSLLDPDSSAVVHPAGWKLPAAWQYALNPSSVPQSVGGANLATIAANAFGQWLAASPTVASALAISRGSDTTINKAQLDGTNIIAWGRTSGTALATSYVWFNPTSGVAAEVDTIFNLKFSWAWSDPATWPSGQECAWQNVYDAEDILTHELGHTMGLDDEYTSAYASNTMFGSAPTGETKKDTLTTGDKLGVGALY